jgi:hypothetical protein
MGFGPSFSFGSSWKVAVNPLGLAGELEAVSASTFATILAGAFGGDIGFTVGAGTKFTYGPSYSFSHGRDVKWVPSKDFEKKRPLDKLAKLLACATGLTTMGSILGWSTEAPDRLGGTQIGLGTTFTGLATICMVLLAKIEYMNFQALDLLKAKEKARFAALSALAADTGPKRNIIRRILKGIKDDIKSALGELKNISTDVNSTVNSIRPKVPTMTDGDWEVQAAGISMTAYDKEPNVIIRALTPADEGTPGGYVIVTADDCVAIQGGTHGVEIHNCDPAAPISVGGMMMAGTITLQQGLKKIVMNTQSITIDAGGLANVVVKNAMNVTLTAASSITLKAGPSTIELDALNGITIKGMMINMTGLLQTVIK